MEPTAGSGSGAAGPVEDDRIQEPDSNASTTAAAPPPLRASATPLHLEQAGGGADGWSPATVVDRRKGKDTVPPLPRKVIPCPPSSSTRSLDYAGRGADGSSCAAAWVDRKGKLVGSIPDFPIAFGAGGSSSSAGRRMMRSFDYELEFKQILRLQQSVIIEEGEEEEQQVESSHAKDALPRKEKGKLRQVKVRPTPEKRKSPWSWLKNKIFRREGKGRQICLDHVQHKTQPISEVRNRYMVSSNGMNSLDGYSEFRPVIGDGECFYRSFIFSYLEQVIDRPDTDEEHRLLGVVETASARHADLGWDSEFPRSSRAFKKLLEEVKRWKNTESTSRCRKEELLKFFSTYDETQDIFAFLRLLVAIEMCSHRLVYEPLIPDVASGIYSLKVWCFLHVTPARVDSEYLMMRALASALDVSLIVETFQGDYARDIYTGPGVPRPAVTLLYNGYHYDIIYPRAPSSESSSHQAS
uniref:OTU domain-containing protein n=2 Tax=Hordeum vulgare subsp. vulgare TaxID=112509 RepID=A0A8I6Y7Q9_HORVV